METENLSDLVCNCIIKSLKQTKKQGAVCWQAFKHGNTTTCVRRILIFSAENCNFTYLDSDLQRTICLIVSVEQSLSFRSLQLLSKLKEATSDGNQTCKHLHPKRKQIISKKDGDLGYTVYLRMQKLVLYKVVAST